MKIKRGIENFVQLGTGAVMRTYRDVLRETIRVTDFSGADAGLQIQAAIVAAPATGAVIDGLGLQGAQTSSVNPFSGITKPITLLLGDVTLSSSVQWAITSTDQDIIGISRDRTKLVYTGGAITDFLLFDGTAIGNGIRFILKDISVFGNANVVNAITIKKAGRFIVETVAAAECTGSGFSCQWCVLGTFINPAVSSNFGTFVVIPDAGITFDWIDPDNSSANTIISPLMEGITGGIGIREIHSQANKYFGGTSEANGTGIDIATTASHHKFHSLYMEANTTQDVVVRGFLNEFIGCEGFSAVANGFEITAAAYLNRIVKGHYDRIVIASGSVLNEVDGAHCQTSFTDGGTDTSVINVRTSGGAIDDKKPINVRELHVRSQTDATPTQLIITAHPSAQGATNLVTVRNAAGADVFSIAAGGGVEFAGTARHLDAILGDPNLFLQPDTGGVTVLRDDAGSEAARVTANNVALSRRLVYGLGATVTAANDLTLGVGGNVFQVSGNTQINAITTANWSGGPLFLLFTGTPTVKHNSGAGGGGTAPILLQGSADLVAAANTVLMLIFDGANWHEVSRKVA